MIEVPDNPAGRLRSVFRVMHSDGGAHSVSSWWQLVAEEVAPEGDVHAVRAEAAALFRDVELVSDLFTAEDERDAYLYHREAWSQGVFSWGLNSKNPNNTAVPYQAEQIVTAESVRWLSAISSILHRDAPEFRVNAGVDADTIVAKVAGDLRQMLGEVKASEDLLHPTLRAAIIRRITTALDDMTYVRLRGWHSLHQDVSAVEVTFAATEQAPAVYANEPLRLRVHEWVVAAREICVEVERIVVPTATGLAVAIATSDVATGLGALVTARGAIEYAASRGRSSQQGELPPGDGDPA